MYPYRYAVSLRFKHPTIDPQAITDGLGTVPKHSWRAGAPRTTPSGDALEGLHRETYWTARLHPQPSLHVDEQSLEDFLSSAIDALESKSSFFDEFVRGGGRAEFFVGVFCSQNLGVMFDTELLKRMGTIQIGLSLDIYPEGESAV